MTDDVSGATPATVKIGVVLDPSTDDVGTWLAQAAAFEAAGADALWIDHGTELDPLVLTSALAAVTYRAILLARTSESDRAAETLRLLSRGRIRTVSGDVADVAVLELDGRRWLAVPVPENRAAWRATLAEAAEAGVDGVLVPADPRLLDLLRNPDVTIDRSDLHIAQG